MPYILGQQLLDEVPEVEDVVHLRTLFSGTRALFGYEEKRFWENNFRIADPSIFNVFTYHFLIGNPDNALNTPNSIVLTERTAKRYFGDENPVGKILLFENRQQFTVTGIIKDIPENSHFIFDLLVPISACKDIFGYDDRQNWGGWNYTSYILLKQNVAPETVEAKLNQIVLRERRNRRDNEIFSLQPLLDIHLHSNLRGEIGKQGDIRNIYFYSAVGMIIMLIACMNFVNLSSAHSVNRSKEVGIRKVIGAYRLQLTKQFIGESIFLSFLGLPIALIFAYFCLPVFNTFSEAALSFAQMKSYSVLGGLAGILIITGLISGSYPAFFTSAFQPVKALKGEKLSRAIKFSIRNILVVIQFTVSVLFIGCTFITHGQMNYVKNRDLGINTEHIINIPLSEKSMFEKSDILKDEFLKSHDVVSVTVSDFLTSRATWGQMWGQDVEWEGMDENAGTQMRWIAMDHDFIKTFDIELIEGRDFSKEILTDEGNAYILNETAIKQTGIPEPVGREFKMEGVATSPGKIIGVIRDFHFKSFHHRIEPLVLYIKPGHPNWNPFWDLFYSIKISGNDIPGTVGYLRATTEKYFPGIPFEYSFLDQDFDKTYKKEQERGRLYGYFSLVAVILACMGLFGLTTFMVESRIKEIGIRKVFGASERNILVMFSKDFIRVVIIANIIAVPVIYYFIDKWLENFAFRISIGIGYFIYTALLTTAIALVTISSRTITAARENPTEALRCE